MVFDMTLDAKGVWSATISKVRPELSSYLYMLDGAPVMDQRNPGAKVGPRGGSKDHLLDASDKFTRFLTGHGIRHI